MGLDSFPRSLDVFREGNRVRQRGYTLKTSTTMLIHRTKQSLKTVCGACPFTWVIRTLFAGMFEADMYV